MPFHLWVSILSTVLLVALTALGGFVFYQLKIKSDPTKRPKFHMLIPLQFTSEAKEAVAEKKLKPLLILCWEAQKLDLF